MIIQLSPAISMTTPKGHGFANFMIDRGMDFDTEWIVFQDTGEIWSWQNRDVRLEKNITYGRDSVGDKMKPRQMTNEEFILWRKRLDDPNIGRIKCE